MPVKTHDSPESRDPTSFGPQPHPPGCPCFICACRRQGTTDDPKEALARFFEGKPAARTPQELADSWDKEFRFAVEGYVHHTTRDTMIRIIDEVYADLAREGPDGE